MSRTVIRDFQPGDAEAVVSLLREIQAHEQQFNRHLKPPAEIGLWYVERILQQCPEHNGHLLVAKRDGQVIGFALVYAGLEEKGEEEEVAHAYALVSELVVAEAHRGEGVGRLLLAECERRAKLAGRDEVLLAVYPQNDAAMGLYRKAGFSAAKLRMAKRI